jgi:hypothetical protein
MTLSAKLKSNARKQTIVANLVARPTKYDRQEITGADPTERTDGRMISDQIWPLGFGARDKVLSGKASGSGAASQVQASDQSKNSQSNRADDSAECLNQSG